METQINPSINAPIIGKTKAIIPPVPVTVPLSTYTAPVVENSAYLDRVEQTKLGEQEALKDVQKQSTDISSLLSQLGGKEAERAQQYEKGGVNNAFNQSQDLAAQGRILREQAFVTPFQTAQAYQGFSGIDKGQSVNRDLLQRNAILSYGVARDQAQADRDYNKAKNLADQQVDVKYAQIEADIASRKAMLDATKDYTLTPAQEKAKSAQQALLKKMEDDKNEKKASEKAVSDMLIEASPVAPPDVIAKATKIKNEGGSAIQVAAALGKYGGDFLKNELLKEQIKTQVSNRTTDELQRKKLQAEINSINTKTSNLTPQPTGKVTAPNGDAIGLPNETLSAIGRLKLNEGQANAVAFTSRMIQSNQALDKQLGTINPKGGFYETTGYDPTSAGSAIGRFTGSDQSRVYVTNSSDFIRAKLRKESGATISPEEMSADAAIYTPSGAGLDEKDLLLAKTKRDEAIKSMIAQAGPAAPYLQQYYEQAKTQGETFMSENPQLNDWYKNTTNAVNTSTAQATTGAASYGFVDNITK